MNREELRSKVEALIGTAILLNDKNYTDDFMVLFDTYSTRSDLQTYVGEEDNGERKWWIARIGRNGQQIYGDAFSTQEAAEEALSKELAALSTPKQPAKDSNFYLCCMCHGLSDKHCDECKPYCEPTGGDQTPGVLSGTYNLPRPVTIAPKGFKPPSTNGSQVGGMK